MAERSPTLQAFLTALETTILDVSDAGSDHARVTKKTFAALAEPGPQTPRQRTENPACTHIQPVLDTAENIRSVKALTAAFRALEPEIAWSARADRKTDDPNFPNAHATGMIIGDGGLEARQDLRMGASLLAPETFYPNHQHPPEEVYIALSPGNWRQEAGPWREPGIGGLVYNSPNIIHAMQSGASALLAIWMLPPS
jgi:hypothetical protein